MVSFHEYYNEFVGLTDEYLNQGIKVVQSEYRDKPLNKKYYYPFIITNYYGNLICSVSKEYLHIANKYFDGTEDSINKIVDKLKKEDSSFRVRKMHRFSYENNKELKHYSIPLTYDIVETMNFNGSISKEGYRQRNKDIIESKRKHVIMDNSKIVSSAFISDIYEQGGNIVVFTDEEYRCKGYGKDVVKGCLDWCIKEDILPIYLVEDSNKASLTIPLNLGFKHQAEEFIISR